MKNRKTINTVSLVLAAVTVLGLYLAGAVTANAMGNYKSGLWGIVAIICLGMLLILGLVSFIGGKLYAKGKNRMKLSDAREYMLMKKGRADVDPSGIRNRLRAVRGFVMLFLSLVFLLLAGYSFALGGLAVIGGIVPFFLIPVILLGVLYRNFFTMTPKLDFTRYTYRKDYPELYRLAQSAADAVGVEGEIYIAILPDCNAGIRRFGKNISLQMGTQLLSVLHPEELYQILLHEFAHLAHESAVSDFGDSLAWRFLNAGEDELEDKPVRYLFTLPGIIATFEFETCQVAASEYSERMADAVILEKGDPSKAASALCKTAMGDLFEGELADFIPVSFYASEEPPQTANTTVCNAFCRAIEERSEFWQGLLEKELPYQIGSHPIFRQRREALGNPDYTVTLPSLEGAFAADVQRAREQIDREMVEAMKESYAERRRVNYLEPLALVERFEATDGKPTAPEIPSLLAAYRDLVRFAEQEALCDRLLADSEYSEYETVAALFIKGCLLLSRYDAAGIEKIYHAIDLNHTYMEGGFNLVGDFCHRMGLQEEMEAYRAKALEQMQEKHDVFDQAGDLNPSDKLLAEDFDGDGRLPAMLDYMIEAGQGKLLRIFLVRKMLSADYFASVFVIQYDYGIPDDVKNEIYDRIYHYLDNYPLDWHYALFVYDRQTEKAVKKVAGSCVYERG